MNPVVTSLPSLSMPRHSLSNFAMRTVGTLALAAAVAIGTAGCAGDRALFPETSYNQLPQGEIELTKPVTIFSTWDLPIGTHVSFQLVGFARRLKTIKPTQDMTIQGGVQIPASSELEFVPAGNTVVMSLVTLGADAEFNGLQFKAKDKVSFDEKGTVTEAFIAGKRKFDGKTYPAETGLWFKDGEVARSETKADRERAAEDHNREVRSCQAGCAPYTGEAYGNCMSHCSML